MSSTNGTGTPSGETETNRTTTDCPAPTDVSSAADSTLATYRLVVEVYLVATLCVAGWIGNALSVAVLRRDRRRYKQGTTNWLLQTLAIVDTAYLATSILIQPLKTIHSQMSWGDDGGSSWFQRVYPYVEPHAWALASIAQTMTVWLVLLVTVDRYFAVCLPMKVRPITTTTTTTTIIIIRLVERYMVSEDTEAAYRLSYAVNAILKFNKKYFIL